MPESSAIAGSPVNCGGGARLDQRVRRETVAVLDRLRTVVADQLVGPEALPQDAPQLLDLVRVVGREHEGRHATRGASSEAS